MHSQPPSIRIHRHSGDIHGQDESRRRSRAGARKRRHRHRLRRAGRRHQPVLLGHAQGRQHQPRAGASRRRRIAHGRRLYARPAGQHRRVYRHVGPRRHRHDHRFVLRSGRLDSYSGYHGPGAARASVQGRFPGRRYRIDRQARHQVGRHRARAGAGAARVPAGLPSDALGPSGSGAGRPADRRAARRDRIRHRHVRAAAGLQAESDAASRSKPRSRCSTIRTSR